MIEKGSLRLRALEPTDLDVLYRWENDLELWQVSNTLTPFSKVQLQRYIQHSSLDIYQTKQLRLMIERQNGGGDYESVGMVDLFAFDPYHLRAGVGIMVHSSFRHQRVASDALTLFVEYCFGRLGLHQLFCSITTSNRASLALFEHLGFELIGIKKEWCKSSTGYEDEAFYQLLNRG